METDNTYISLSRLTGSREILEKNSFFMLLKVATKLTEEFERRAEQGSYVMNVSEDRVLINPANCGVAFSEGAFKRHEGRFRLAAPEILDGLAEDGEYGSRYTLAVLLFHLLVQSYPFEGKMWLSVDGEDATAAEAFYRNSPPFLFSEKTDRNRPKLGVQNNAIAYWSIYPGFFKQAFLTTFDGGERLSFSAWRGVLAHLTASLTLCENCGAEIFLEDGAESRCWRCNAPAGKLELRLFENGLVKKRLPLAPELKHVDGKNSFEVVVRGARWGVKNTTDTVWKWMKPNGLITEIAKNEAVPVTRGMEIRFRGGGKLVLGKAQDDRTGGEKD